MPAAPIDPDPSSPDPLAGYRAALAAAEPPPLAGIWPRLNAQAVDAAILAVPGWLLSAAISAGLPDLRAAEPIIVFAVALIYYAVLDSRIGGGRTFGKLWAGIRVVGRDGAAISLPRAALRFLVLALPDFFGFDAVLNSHPDAPGLLPQLAAAAVGMAVVGSQVAGLYLFLCNRRTRQALHDLLADSFVVRGKHPVAPGGLSLTAPRHGGRGWAARSSERLAPSPNPLPQGEGAMQTDGSGVDFGLGNATLAPLHAVVVTILLALSMAVPAVVIDAQKHLGVFGSLLGDLLR